MKKIFTTGLIAFLVAGIILFVVKAVVVDILPSFFGPLILFLFGKDYLMMPLSLVFTVLIIFLLGLLVSRVDLKKLMKRLFLKKKVPGEIAKKEVALYKGEFVAIMKEIKYKRINGKAEKRYVIYRPATPLIWTSGLPITVVREKEITPLKISFLELYSIVASFGKNTPELLEEMEELKIQSAD